MDLNFINKIGALDANAIQAAKERQSKLAKPPGSLGELENISIKLAGITGKVNNDLLKRRIIVLCADNGIVEEAVSCTPRNVTAQQAANMTKHLTGMSSMAYYFGDDVQVVDVGIADPYDARDILNHKIMPGTHNFLKENAMSREQCIEAILVGERLAKLAKEHGMNVIGVGEMGIGNTTTSSAILSILTGLPVEAVTGRGGGLTDDAFKHKKEVIENAIKLRDPNKNDVIDVMSKVGGLDIAAMCGVFLGAAEHRVPVVIDGFISIVAALCAYRLCPLAADYMFASHISFEPGYKAALKELGLHASLDLCMRLGEGSGCPIMFELMQAACVEMNDMALFNEDSGINDNYLEEIRKGDHFSI